MGGFGRDAGFIRVAAITQAAVVYNQEVELRAERTVGVIAD